MDYGKLLQRAWNIVVQNPYLLLLGILIALTSTSSGSGTSYNVSEEEMGRVIGGGPLLDQMEAWMGVAMAAMIGLMCLAVVIFMLIWVAQQVARGGLIAGVDFIEDDESTSLGDAWRAGWARKWTLLGIGLVVLIPILVLVLLGVAGVFVFFGAALGGDDFLSPEALFGGAMFGILGLLCLFVPIALLIGLWSEFAYRACMLEGKGVFASYGRAWHVLFDNIGPVVVIVLIRIAAGIVLFLPALIGSLCCLLWPVLLILQGAVTTYFSTVWTLAWREFTFVPDETSAELLEPAE